MWSQRVPLVGLAFVISMVAAGCGEDTPDDAASAEAAEAAEIANVDDLRAAVEGEKVVVGTSGAGTTTVIGAQRMADFLTEEFGVDVEFRVLESDPLIAATIGGQVDVGQLSFAGMANAVASGADFVAFGSSDQKNQFLVVSEASITSMEELRGKPFGASSNLNQITGQTGRKCLAEAGLDIEQDVQLLRLNNTGEVLSALEAGQVAGGIASLGRLTPLLVRDGEDAYNILCRGWEANPQISSVLYASREWLDANPKMALAMNVAALRAARWSKEDKQQWIDYAIEHIDGYSQEVGELDYQKLVEELDDWPVNGGLDRELMQQTLDTSFEFEAIDTEYTVDEIATLEFQEQALELIGRV